MSNSDMPAMPTKHNSEYFQHSNDYTTGLTKREHFAGLALATLRAEDFNTRGWAGAMADQAVCIADALLAELDKDNGNR